MNIENIQDHKALKCGECGGVNYALLQSGKIECNKCQEEAAGRWDMSPINTSEEKNTDVFTRLESAAIDLCVPPFEFYHGYIKDSKGNTIADDGDIGAMEEMIAARIRGWGRLSYIEGEHSPADIQDTIGRHIATALNEYWAKHSGPTP